MLSGWQVQAMKEAEDARIWEELNAPDPYESVLKEAAKDMDKAIGFLDIAMDRLADASADLTETPMQAKVDSFIDTLDDIMCDLKEIKKHWERGERE